eukprot:SAG22_NODE_255_length_13562_cov_6.101463_11_plen_242_part_00
MPSCVQRFITAPIETVYRVLMRREWDTVSGQQHSGSGAGHFYEVIREGRPCHLYFDLEFDRAANPTSDGSAMTTAFIAFICRQLQSWRGRQLHIPEDAIVDLDASSDKKFSRHVVLRLDRCAGGAGSGGAAARAGEVAGYAFSDNLAMGRFVQQAMAVLAIEAKTSPELAALWIWPKGGDLPGAVFAPFVDLGVYTRNRCFRLYGCAKVRHRVTLYLVPTPLYVIWRLPAPPLISQNDAVW